MFAGKNHYYDEISGICSNLINNRSKILQVMLICCIFFLQLRTMHGTIIVPWTKLVIGFGVIIEAATRGVLCKKVLLEISQNS